MSNHKTNQTSMAASTSSSAEARFLQQRLAQAQDNLNDLPDDREELRGELQVEVKLINELLTELDGGETSLVELLRNRLQEAEEQLADRPDRDKIGYDEAYFHLAYEREALRNILTGWEARDQATS